MMNIDGEIVIEYPWSMIPIELFAEMIADMESRIPKSRPLFGKKLVPNLRHQEKPIWIWDNDTDGNYVVFDFSKIRKQEVPWYIFEPNLLEAIRKYECKWLLCALLKKPKNRRHTKVGIYH